MSRMASLAGTFHTHASIRRATEGPARPLSPEDYAVCIDAEASPTKWHLAHPSWFFETFLLPTSRALRAVPRRRFRTLFKLVLQRWVANRHARPRRGLLVPPSLERFAPTASRPTRPMPFCVLSNRADPRWSCSLASRAQHQI